MTMHRPDLPAIDRAKIHAEVLVPILQHLQDEVGRERALEILRAAVGEMTRKNMSEFVDAVGNDKAVAVVWRGVSDKATWERVHPLVVEDREVTDTLAEFDVVDCGYAKYFNEIGQPELGFLMVCSADFDMIDSVPEIELTRSQTRMQGAQHCDFRYRLRRSSET